MNREISSLPLPAPVRERLTIAGFITVEDVHDLAPSELSGQTGWSAEESLEVLEIVRKETECSKSFTQFTALELLEKEAEAEHIITFSEHLDELIGGGGVPLGKITEFCGAPGVGKTQMCMQLSVDAQIPRCFGGVGGDALYLDTEGSFVVRRVADIAKATVSHCQKIAAAEKTAEMVECIKSLTVEHLLSRITYQRCHDYIQLIAAINHLPQMVQENRNIKLIIVDSVAFHFRHDFDDYPLRSRLLNSMAQTFTKMATEDNVAVVLTNQMTTKFDSGSSYMVPALGENWGHASTIRVVLYWDSSRRYAMLYKSPSQQERVVPFQVTAGGIRDDMGVSIAQHNVEATGDWQESAKKRQRIS